MVELDEIRVMLHAGRVFSDVEVLNDVERLLAADPAVDDLVVNR